MSESAVFLSSAKVYDLPRLSEHSWKLGGRMPRSLHKSESCNQFKVEIILEVELELTHEFGLPDSRMDRGMSGLESRSVDGCHVVREEKVGQA